MNVIGGGGTAKFDDGLPSFEMAVADLYPSFASSGVTGYNMDASLEGSSIFWGYQLGASYEINEMLSVYLGARYVVAKNTYDGYLKNVTVDDAVSGTTMPASTYLQGVGAALQTQSDNILAAIDLWGSWVADELWHSAAGDVEAVEIVALGQQQPDVCRQKISIAPFSVFPDTRQACSSPGSDLARAERCRHRQR